MRPSIHLSITQSVPSGALHLPSLSHYRRPIATFSCFIFRAMSPPSTPHPHPQSSYPGYIAFTSLSFLIFLLSSCPPSIRHLSVSIPSVLASCSSVSRRRSVLHDVVIHSLYIPSFVPSFRCFFSHSFDHSVPSVVTRSPHPLPLRCLFVSPFVILSSRSFARSTDSSISHLLTQFTHPSLLSLFIALYFPLRHSPALSIPKHPLTCFGALLNLIFFSEILWATLNHVSTEKR